MGNTNATPNRRKSSVTGGFFIMKPSDFVEKELSGNPNKENESFKSINESKRNIISMINEFAYKFERIINNRAGNEGKHSKIPPLQIRSYH